MSIRSAILFALVACFSCGDAKAGLVAFFDFDGNSNDHSGSGNVAVVDSSGYASGFEGQSIDLSGSGNNVYVPLVSSLFDRPVQTMGAWVKLDRSNARQSILTIDDGDPTTFNRSVGVDNRGPGNWKYTAFHGPNQYATIGGRPGRDWTFIAARYDGSEVTMFIDGRSVSATDGSSRNLFNQSSLLVGDNALSGGDFQGEIDNLFLFNEALTDTQINTIRTNGRAGIMAVAIPEPSFFGLGLLSLAGISLRRKRRKRL